MSANSDGPARRTAWTLKQRLVRLMWMTLGRAMWVLLPPARASVLRLFGGTVGQGCRLPGNVDIVIPWNLRMGDRVFVGDHTILYGLGPITIGDDVVIDCRAHLCAGTHDLTDPAFPLRTPPIMIGAETLIGVDAYIAPNVVLGKRCRVWPRASVHRSYGDETILRGNPARPIDPADDDGDDDVSASTSASSSQEAAS